MSVPEPAPRREQPRMMLGELLLAAGAVSSDELAAAVRAQSLEGGRLGRHLILTGAVTRRDVYAELALQWDAPLVDLVAEPPDPALLDLVGREEVLRGEWVPWRRDGDTVTIATSVPPSPALLGHAAALCRAARVEVRTTTDWDIVQAVQAAFRTGLLYESAERLASESSRSSAKYGLRWWQVAVPAVLALVVLVGLVMSPVLVIGTLFAVANLVFTMNVVFKVGAGLRAPVERLRARWWSEDVERARGERGLTAPVRARVPDDELPFYTILIPVYREANVIQKVLENIGALDYPHSRLDVLVLLEEDDVETIAAAKSVRPPEYVRLLVVPRGEPQTKPRACNYGLTFARGELVVIYDAEDRPDPGQLRMVVEEFTRDDVERVADGSGRRRMVCVQAALNYFNADYNVLTRMFAVEYAHWFDSMLPGLDGFGVPIPLGGTSNHFRTAELVEMGAWDPYNVTEDADLGLRVSAYGYRVGTVASTTWEEATSRVGPWIRQRTRWIKGYMVTTAVNTRHLATAYRYAGVRGVISLVGLVGGTPLVFLMYPLALGLTVLTYVGTGIVDLPLPSWLVWLGTVNMLASNGLMIVFSGIAAWRRYSWRIAVFALASPVYWLLHSVAAWRAAWQLVVDPFRWEKTPHGLSEDHDDSLMHV